MTRLDVFAPITKRVKDPETGHLTVFGKITGPDLDLDKQRMDPDWLRKAVPDWFTSGANVRMMHQPVAVGKGVELSEEDDGWYLSSKIVDRDAIEKIDHDVLTGYSIGIKSPQIRKGKDAPNGIICGGIIVETSVVDRPCLPTAKFVMAKSAEASDELTPAAEWVGTEDLDAASATQVMTKFGWTAEQWDTLPEPGKASVTDMLAKSPLEGAVVSEADSAAMYAQIVERFTATKDANTEVDAPAEVEPDATKSAEPEPAPVPGAGDDLDARIERAVEAALAKQAAVTPPAEIAAAAEVPTAPAVDTDAVALRAALKSLSTADLHAGAAYLTERATEKGRADLLPQAWKDATPDLAKGDWVHDPAQLAAVRDGLISLMKAELDEFTQGDDERCDIYQLLRTLSGFLDWWSCEAAMGETSSPFGPPDDMAGQTITVDLAAEPETAKTVTPQTPAFDEERVNQLITAAMTKATDASKERINALEAELAKVKSAPIPGGPVLTRTAADTNRAAVKDEYLVKATRYRAMADQVPDPKAKAGYLQMAAEADARAAESDA